MKKSVAVLFIMFCAVIGGLVGGYFGYAHNISARATDTATLSLYVSPQGGSTTIAPTGVSGGGGSTGLTKNATTAQPNQIVLEKENPLPVNKTFNVYPVLGILGLIALLLIIIWLIIKHMRAERDKKKKARARGKKRGKR
jgi:hypothetical protein